jgi:hypothetical protein
MFTSAFRGGLLLAAALVLIPGLVSPPIAAAEEACGSADRLAVALHFAQVLFPELKGRELNVAVSEGMGSFFVSASEADGFQLRFDKPTWQPPGQTNQKSDAALTETMRKGGIELPFYLYFSFVKMSPPLLPRRLSCRPITFTSDAGHEQMQKLQQTLDPHPDWSDAQELEESRKLGLRYGPEDKDAVLQLIPLKELSQLYGSLKIESARLSMNAGGKCSGCSFAYPTWEIKVAAKDTVRWLSITIEPFFGRITKLSSGE